MLEVRELCLHYKQSQILFDVSLSVERGAISCVMGTNGVGKTSLLKAISGVHHRSSGTYIFDGREIQNQPPHVLADLGVAYVPQGRMIFPYLTVEENLLAGMETVEDKTIPDFVYDVFPVLKEMRSRRGGNLSGGQQQQLAIARALVSRPQVFLLDEPTEGIQPSIIKDIAKTLNELRAELGFALLVAEQALSFALDTADRFLIIERGRIAHEATRENVDEAEIRSYLTI